MTPNFYTVEHLKFHDEHGDAERLSHLTLSPIKASLTGTSFVAKQRKGKLNCSLHFLPSDFCKVH